jgi:hypothetical protein
MRLRFVKIDIEAIKSSAEQGDTEAQFNMGNLYYSGRGVPQSYGDAVTWYIKAAEKGHSYAQFNLGLIYYAMANAKESRGLDASYKKAVKWLYMAAKQGDAGALSMLEGLKMDGKL